MRGRTHSDLCSRRSKRRVTPERAAAISEQVPDSVLRVAVMLHPEPASGGTLPTFFVRTSCKRTRRISRRWMSPTRSGGGRCFARATHKRQSPRARIRLRGRKKRSGRNGGLDPGGGACAAGGMILAGGLGPEQRGCGNSRSASGRCGCVELYRTCAGQEERGKNAGLRSRGKSGSN